MKILHVIPGLKNASGPTQAVLNLAKHTQNKGHQVVVVYVSGRGTDPKNLPVYDFEIKAFPYFMSRKWAYSPSLNTYLKKNISSFDIVHLHGIWLFPNLSVGINGKRSGVPYIVRPAGSLDPVPLKMKGNKKKLYLQLIERKIIDGAAAIHVVSDREAKNVKELNFTTPIIHIPNGIEPDKFNSDREKSLLRQEFKFPKDKVLVLTLGRISPIKNLEFLGRVLKECLSVNDQLRYVMAGPDHTPYAKSLKKYYEDLGIMDKCYFVGEVKGRQKTELLNACDIFCMPSLSENFGIAALEALAAGLPLIISENTPWQQINEYGAGYCLPLSEEVFSTKLIQLCEDQQLRTIQSEQALTIASNFAWSNISKKMIESYQEITNLSYAKP